MRILDSLLSLLNRWDDDLAELLALHYLESPCRAAELQQGGASDSLTVWLRTQVTYVRGEWVDIGTGVKCRLVNRDVDYGLSLNAMSDAAKQGLLHVTKSTTTGGSPLWSLPTNDIFRFVHDLNGHVLYGLGFTTAEEIELAVLTANDYQRWALNDPTWSGHWTPEQRLYAAQALLSEIGLQALAVRWLGGFDKTRKNPYTGEVMHYSQKVVL